MFPRIQWSKGTTSPKDFELYRERAERALSLSSHMGSKMLLSELQDADPDVNGYRYAGDMSITSVDGGVFRSAIFLSGKKITIRSSDLDRKAMAIFPVNGSSKAVRAVSLHNPWPASFVPLDLTVEKADVLSASQSKSEIDKLVAKLMRNKTRVEADLRRVGLVDYSLVRTNHVVGAQASEMIAYAVLRKEFGIGVKGDANWRPSIKAVRAQDKIGKAALEYIKTGKHPLLNLNTDTMRFAQLKSLAEGFASRLL